MSRRSSGCNVRASWCASLFRRTWHGHGHGNEGPSAVCHPFTALLLGDPGDVMLERRRGRAIGRFHAGYLGGHVNNGDVLAEVTNVLNGASVRGAGHRTGLFVGKKLLNGRRALGISSKRIDEISILDKEGGHEFGIVFAPGGAPFVMALVDGSIFLL